MQNEGIKGGGHRFGFVRFLGVKNEKLLEERLDSIRIIDQEKMYVNIPRLNRPMGIKGKSIVLEEPKRNNIA